MNSALDMQIEREFLETKKNNIKNWVNDLLQVGFLVREEAFAKQTYGLLVEIFCGVA